MGLEYYCLYWFYNDALFFGVFYMIVNELKTFPIV